MGWIRAKMRRWRTGCLDTFGGYCDAAQGASGLGKGNGAVRDVGRSAFIHSAGPTSRLWPMRACQKSNAWRSPHTQHARVTRATRTMNSHSYTRPSLEIVALVMMRSLTLALLAVATVGAQESDSYTVEITPGRIVIRVWKLAEETSQR